MLSSSSSGSTSPSSLVAITLMSANTLTPFLKLSYSLDMFSVPLMAMMGCGTGSTRILDRAKGTWSLVPSPQVIFVSISRRLRPGAGNSLVLR